MDLKLDWDNGASDISSSLAIVFAFMVCFALLDRGLAAAADLME